MHGIKYEKVPPSPVVIEDVSFILGMNELQYSSPLLNRTTDDSVPL
jgi:hypothetical protein